MLYQLIVLKLFSLWLVFWTLLLTFIIRSYNPLWLWFLKSFIAIVSWCFKFLVLSSTLKYKLKPISILVLFLAFISHAHNIQMCSPTLHYQKFQPISFVLHTLQPNFSFLNPLNTLQSIFWKCKMFATISSFFSITILQPI